MLTAKIWDQSQDAMGETCNGGGGKTNIIAHHSGLPLPVIIPSSFHTALVYQRRWWVGNV